MQAFFFLITTAITEQFGTNLRTICYFDYHTLKRATGNFNPRNQLGKGGFGPVYQVFLNWE